MNLLTRISNLLFPPKCVLCRRVLETNETDLCHRCRVDGPKCNFFGKALTLLDSWCAVWYYEGAVRKSILRYKFLGARWQAAAYGRMLAMVIQQEHPEGFDVLTWIPTSAIRKLRRGYDQVELLANAVGQELGMQPQRLLKKVRNNPPQSRIVGQAARKANVFGVYRVVNKADLAGKRILLLDDIITTGATASEAARMLLTAGALQVHCAAVAATRHNGKNK